MTLVVGAVFASSSALSAPTPPKPDLDEPATPDESQIQPADKSVTDTIDITPVKSLDDDRGGVVSSEYFFPYRNSMSPRVGVIYNTEEYGEDKRFLYAVGFGYLFQTKTRLSYEAGVDLVSNSEGRVHFARRWFFSRARLRPYAKAGGGVKIVARDGLATILRFENIQGRGSLGFERLVLVPLSLRFELELAVSTKDVEGIASAGYSWAW